MDEETKPDAAQDAPAKPKGPRRESTKIAAAMKLAQTHPNAAALLAMFAKDAKDAKPQADALALAEQIAQREKGTAAMRADLLGRRQFIAEIDGLAPEILGGVKAVLEARK